jgi:cytosine/adenosine deaminase-related metal-dependent hydrolase
VTDTTHRMTTRQALLAATIDSPAVLALSNLGTWPFGKEAAFVALDAAYLY